MATDTSPPDPSPRPAPRTVAPSAGSRRTAGPPPALRARRGAERPAPRSGRTTAPDDEDSGVTPAARLDARRRHVVDRARDYVALADAGRTVTQIARFRRKSKGYVSVLLRFGRVLAELPPEEAAAYRSPRITYAVLRRLIRADTPLAEIRAQLRLALGGFSSHTQRPAQRAAARPARPGGTLAGWAWDQALFDADPEAYVRDYLDRLLGLQRTVAARVRQAVAAAGARAVGAGSPSLTHLTRKLAEVGATRTAAEQAPAAAQRALTALAALEAGLAPLAEAARAHLAPAPSGPASHPALPPRPPGGPIIPASRPGAPSALADAGIGAGIDADEIEADLADG